MVSEFQLKKQICDICKRIYDRRMAAADDGNISVKISDNEYLCTPDGISKGLMTPECICKIDGEGNVIQPSGKFKPSAEIKMHLRVYKKRPDIKAVVNAHPVYATSFAIAGMPLTQPIMTESVTNLGCVPVAEYATHSSNDNLEKYLSCFDAVLLENNGALTYSDSLYDAYQKMESLEFYAELIFRSNELGGPKEFDKEQINSFYANRKQLGFCSKHPAQICLGAKNGGISCHTCRVSGGDLAEKKLYEDNPDTDMIIKITKKVMKKLF